jgi:hypothetical protein
MIDDALTLFLMQVIFGKSQSQPRTSPSSDTWYVHTVESYIPIFLYPGTISPILVLHYLQGTAESVSRLVPVDSL